MSFIRLSKELQSELEPSLFESGNPDAWTEIFRNNCHVRSFLGDLKKVLNEDLYVHVKGMEVNSTDKRKFLAALAEQFGEYYGAVESTGIKIDCEYTGCSRNSLILHNDDAIDIDRQPRVSFIQVIREDPALMVENGVVVMRDLVRCLKYENPSLLDSLFNTPIPMLSLGVNYESDNKKERTTNEPIIREREGNFYARFDLHRNKFYYKYKKLEQKPEESRLVYEFLRSCENVKKKVNLELGDILILKNKETLHDRSQCSIEYGLDGSLNTREILVSFAR
jgi:hypothetical protein